MDISDRHLTLGEALRRARHERGLTQAEAAQAIGISQPVLSTWERDRRRPNMDQLARVAYFFGVDFAQLLDLALGGVAA